MNDADIACRVCGSRKVFCIQETHCIDRPYAIIHLGYCERCAKDIEHFELELQSQRRRTTDQSRGGTVDKRMIEILSMLYSRGIVEFGQNAEIEKLLHELWKEVKE